MYRLHAEREARFLIRNTVALKNWPSKSFVFISSSASWLKRQALKLLVYTICYKKEYRTKVLTPLSESEN